MGTVTPTEVPLATSVLYQSMPRRPKGVSGERVRFSPQSMSDPKRVCVGNMGLCQSKRVTECTKCRKFYCSSCIETHPRFCRGIP